MKVVLDTNTVLSALLFRRGHVSWIREHWRSRLWTPLCCQATISELTSALAYPKFALNENEVRSLLDEYLLYVEVVHIGDPSEELPQCRDPDDQMLLEVAHAGNADVLVTGDDDLLAIADRLPFTIETPAEFKKRFDETTGSTPSPA